jgi:N-acetylglutamate synthase-like GNAT family acetyltransferase
VAGAGTLAGGALDVSLVAQRYPRTMEIARGEVSLALMSRDDEAQMLQFARSLPAHDLLFLRRNITHPKVLSAWSSEIEAGSIVSLIAREAGNIVGCSAVVRDELSFSPHVGELRVLVSPQGRDRGLGRMLIQESFLIALSLKLEKLTAQMTVDQKSAIAVFEEMGFQAEALLKEHVRDPDGVKHDIVVLSHDVERFQAQMEAYGLTNVF